MICVNTIWGNINSDPNVVWFLSHRPLEIFWAAGEKRLFLNISSLCNIHRKELAEFRETFSDEIIKFVSAKMIVFPKSKEGIDKIGVNNSFQWNYCQKVLLISFSQSTPSGFNLANWGLQWVTNQQSKKDFISKKVVISLVVIYISIKKNSTQK